MSAIDDYNAAKGHAETLRAFARSANKETCDKFGASVQLTDTHMGFYGNSSCSTWPDSVIKEIVREISVSLRAFALKAATRADSTAESLRQKARGEAQEILQETRGGS